MCAEISRSPAPFDVGNIPKFRRTRDCYLILINFANIVYKKKAQSLLLFLTKIENKILH